VRSLKRQVVLPSGESWERLTSSLRQMALKISDGDFSGLRWIEPVRVATERKRLKLMRDVIRTITVMGLPALGVVIIGLIIPLGGTYHSAALLSFGWAVLYLLLSIDPTLRGKMDTALDLLNTARGNNRSGSSPQGDSEKSPKVPLSSYESLSQYRGNDPGRTR
jgi:hypothetical protein